VLNPDHVAIISNILSDDKARAPVWGLNSKLKLSRPAAVKTGTTNDWKDAWAVGYTPYVTVGVWTGNNNNEETAKVESLTGGGIIWHNVMEELFANPKFEKLLAEPYPNGKLPLDFKLPDDVKSKSICPLPGAFGNYSQELFAPDMLKRAPNSPAEAAPTTEAADLTRSLDGCTAFKKLTVAVLDNRNTPVVDGQPDARSQYCIPADGAAIDPERIKTISIWNFPPPDPDEKIEYRWDSGGASGDTGGDTGGDKPVGALKADSIPPCTDEMLAALAPLPPGAIHMPDLRLLGENQAKEKLAALGITNVYVDYQTRDRIPDVYDTYGPYVVISSLPAAGETLLPGTTVVLGIRAPDEAATPWPPPTTPSDQPIPAQPTPEPPTPEAQPPQPTAEPGGGLFGPTPTTP
jgi:peptidoglycan glycosyltransferase